MKTLKISKDLHNKLKIEAANKNTTILKLLMEILMKHFGMLMVLIMFTGCATSLVPVDKPNMARFTHDQKIIEGLTRNEVLSRLGSPDQAFETTFGAKGAIVWRYNYKIFCSQRGTRCDVYFRNNRVIYHSNFRLEFTNVVAN